jgi:multimeric flavodoxin WrbA
MGGTYMNEKIYKVLLINGSPHADGTTSAALKAVADSLTQEGIECETVHVGKERVGGCAACYACSKLKKCVFDDVVNLLADKMREADGVVIGSPVHYASAAGGLTAILDRLFYSSRFDKSMKVGAAVVAARRGGCTATFDMLNKYFTISGMPVVSSSYWNQIHGGSREEAERDEEGMQTMRMLGKNMAFLIKSIALGKEAYGLPEKEAPQVTNYIR